LADLMVLRVVLLLVEHAAIYDWLTVCCSMISQERAYDSGPKMAASTRVISNSVISMCGIV